MKDPNLYLIHIAEAIEKITGYIEDGELEFQNKPIIQDAVIRNLEIIGEAAKRVPEGLRERAPRYPGSGLPACVTS